MIYAAPGRISRGSDKRALLPVRVPPCPVKGTGMQWFRFYSEALDDPKVQRLPGDLFKAWVNLLCLANEQDERGTLPTVDDIAFRLRLDHQKAEDALLGLKRAGLVEVDPDTDNYVIHAWDKRQPESDSSTERVRRFRAKQHGTPDETRRNEGETLQKRSGNALDKNRVEKSREEQSRSIGGAAAPRHDDAPLPPPKFPRPEDQPPPKRPPDLLFEAVCEACGIDWHQLTDSERGKVNAALGQIRKAGAAPSDVRAHAENYALHFNAPLTPNALAGNWAKTANPPVVRFDNRGSPGRQRTSNTDANRRAILEALP